MADAQLRSVIKQLRRIVGTKEGEGALSDAQLLERFLYHRDDAAIEMLVWRHGTMVLNLCRRVLQDEHCAEDAFQATFLVFVRKAESIGKHASVGSWLCKVAYRVAHQLRCKMAKQPQLRGEFDDVPGQEPISGLVWCDLRPVLDEEIDRLPELYRSPFVLRYLQGHTNEESAELLGCSKAAIRSRLSRGREKLRSRLLQRGLALPASWFASHLSANASSALVSTPLVDTTVKAANAFVAGDLTVGSISHTVSALAHHVLRAMLIVKLKKCAAAAAIAVITVVLAVQWLPRWALAHAPPTREVGGREGTFEVLAKKRKAFSVPQQKKSVLSLPWAQWRGLNRDGLSAETGMLERWTATPPLMWRASGLGSGFAGPVIDSGLVITVGNRQGNNTVIAISDKDGKEIWATKIGDAKQGGLPRANCTPTIDGDMVYALGSDGDLACLKKSTGELIWQKSFRKEYDGQCQDFGYAESPLVDGDKLICSPGGARAGIVALDKKTGAEIWRCQPYFNDNTYGPGASYSSVVISYGAGIKQYVQLMKAGLVGVDAATGKQLWSYSKLGADNSPSTSIVRGDYVFNPCGLYNGSALLKLVGRADGGVDAKEVYLLEPRKLATYSGHCVLVGDYVYGSHVQGSIPHCHNLMTGKMVWQKERGPGTGPAAVIYADGHLYFQYESGVIALVAASPEKYQLKGEFTLPSSRGGLSHPAISNGRLYVRDQDELYCHDVKK